MPPFRFRLARVLDWYRRQLLLEEERLSVCVRLAAADAAAIEKHSRELLAREMEVIRSPDIRAFELVALAASRRRAREQEEHLRRKKRDSDQALSQQRAAAQAAQQRLRLIEKLYQRRLNEHSYEAARELEQLASESHLASFARGLNPSL